MSVLLWLALFIGSWAGAALPADKTLPPSDEELASLEAKISGYDISYPDARRPAGMPVEERKALEKGYAESYPWLSVRISETAGKKQAEGLSRFLSDPDIRATPILAVSLGVPEGWMGGIKAPQLHKVFRPGGTGYAGDKLFVPDTLAEPGQVYDILRYLQGMSLKTWEVLEKGADKEARALMKDVDHFLKKGEIAVVIYEFSAHKKRLVAAGVKPFAEASAAKAAPAPAAKPSAAPSAPPASAAGRAGANQPMRTDDAEEEPDEPSAGSRGRQ